MDPANELPRYTAPTADHVAGAADSTEAWASVGTPQKPQEQALPASLRVGDTAPITNNPAEQSFPPSLQIGSTDATPRSSWESGRSSKPEANAAAMAGKLQRPMGSSPPAHSKNPFRRAQEQAGPAPESSKYTDESNANPWSTETSTAPTTAPRNDLDLLNQTKPVPTNDPDASIEPWVNFDEPTNRQTPTASNGDWHHHVAKLGAKPIPNHMHSTGFSVENSSQGMPQLQNLDNRAAQAPELASRQPQKELAQNQRPFSYSIEHSQAPPYMASPGPSVPPQNLLESSPSPYTATPGPSALPQQLLESSPSPPAQPPRPPKTTTLVDNHASVDVSLSETQSQDPARPKKATETYQIRLINWFDASSPKNPRRSPIMVQNANGPCPLLALVNALVLSTPSTLTTPLIETLRVREQVSLGLLLDAVIDELMSGRRGDAAQNLPDVSDLYAFLVNLHTGMNVNPRFVPVQEAINLMDDDMDMSDTAPTHNLRRPGGFEETREMRLYRIFAIPLIHGWIPPASHPAFASLKRAAKTYEDAQNLMFREEELEDKLKIQGLNQEEQVTLEDISSIKFFLSSTATQLTGYGLNTVTESLAPGALAILFRNDHFSTLYQHPQSGQLFTLVTDMGYAGHDEVVWESLVDVSGEGSEFYSGDFRPVGNIPQEIQHTNEQTNGVSDPNDDGWTTVSNTRSRKGPQANASNSENVVGSTSGLSRLETLDINNDRTPLSPNVEQEDHDLALAMQLQEEEEDRERREAAARRREDELSQAYLNNSDASGRRTFPGFGRGATGAPSVPPRGGSQQGPAARPPVRRKDSSSEDAPPPSYEQAAKGPAYHPPVNHPAYSPSPGGSAPRPPQPQRPRVGSSAYSEHAAGVPFGGSPSTHGPPRGRGPGGRHSSSAGGPSIARRRTNDNAMSAGPDDDGRKDKDCVLM